MKDKFVVVWDSNGKQIDILLFRTDKEFYSWLQEHKNARISVYEGTCVLDWS